MLSPGQVAQIPISNELPYQQDQFLNVPQFISQTTVETSSFMTEMTHIEPGNDKITAGVSDADATDGFTSENMLFQPIRELKVKVVH